MLFLPYENLKIKTNLSKKEVLRRIEDAIEPRRFFRWFEARHKPYQGSVDGDHFNISRLIFHRNSFLPFIDGRVYSKKGGCIIHVTMQPNIVVVVFLVFWFGGVGWAFLKDLSAIITTGLQTNVFDFSELLFSGGMFAFGYVLIVGSFKFESVKSKTFLRELFQATKVEETGIVNLLRKVTARISPTTHG